MSGDMFIISLLCALQIFAAVTFSHYLTVDSSTTLPLLQKGTQSANEIELNAEETFRHPAFLIHGNPILGYFHRSPGHRAMARLPTGTILTYSPPLSPILRPLPGHLSRSPDSSSSVSELPSSWSPLVSTGDKSPAVSNEVAFDENKSEESRSDASPARPSVEASPPPQFLYPQRPMLPYRHPGYIAHSGIPTRGYGTIADFNGNINSEPVKEIKETIRSVETSDEVKASEALAKANFIQTNWIALITSMILLALAALGVVGYFVWKGRIGDTSIPPPPVPRQSS